MKNNIFDPGTETDVLEKEDIKSAEESQLILWNDDVNTFDFVIKCLVEICKHDAIQAEQCAYLVHHTGKCSVKQGAFKKLRPLCEALIDRGLSATIE